MQNEHFQVSRPEIKQNSLKIHPTLPKKILHISEFNVNRAYSETIMRLKLIHRKCSAHLQNRYHTDDCSFDKDSTTDLLKAASSNIEITHQNN